jgi:hypothetical protein
LEPHLLQGNRFQDDHPLPSAARSTPPAAARKVILLWFGVAASLGADYRTNNFAVSADNPEIARQIGEAAEKCRKRIARQWLGRELPAWTEPCLLDVGRSPDGRRGGYSTFYFEGGRVLGQQLTIKGSLPELLPKVLPHEVTHSILAHYFGCPVPRWADEGTAILSEDEAEKDRRDAQMLAMLGATDKAYSLACLFGLQNYPHDPRVFYTQSYSITRFLVDRGGHPKFLKFLDTGMRSGWDQAVRAHYSYRNLVQLEQAWKKQLRFTKLRLALAKELPPLLRRLRAECPGLEKAPVALASALVPEALWRGSTGWLQWPTGETQLVTNDVPRGPALGERQAH